MRDSVLADGAIAVKRQPRPEAVLAPTSNTFKLSKSRNDSKKWRASASSPKPPKSSDNEGPPEFQSDLPQAEALEIDLRMRLTLLTAIRETALHNRSVGKAHKSPE